MSALIAAQSTADCAADDAADATTVKTAKRATFEHTNRQPKFAAFVPAERTTVTAADGPTDCDSFSAANTTANDKSDYTAHQAADVSTHHAAKSTAHKSAHNTANHTANGAP